MGRWWTGVGLGLALLGVVSLLYVWAAPLTGNVGRTMVFTGPNEFDMGGLLRSLTLQLQQQSTDPASPPTGYWQVYPKSTGLFARDPAGNVYGPFGTGGGGGSATFATVRVATTANITLSGEQTIDGVTTSASRVLVKDQSTGSQNGIYVSASGAWARATDFDTSAEFVAGFPVYVQGGTVNGTTVWNLSVIGSFTLNTTSATFARTGPGPFGEILANKDQASGYAGLTAGSKIKALELLDYAAHTALAAANTINPTVGGVLRTIVGIQGSTDPGTVDLTSNPQITAGTSDGQLLMLVGTSATALVQLDNGTGVRLCGNTGNLIIGLNRAKPLFKWNATLSVWEQLGCQDLQGASQVGRSIIADQTNPVIIRDSGGTNRYELYVDSGTNEPTLKAICSGAACANTTIGPLPIGGKFRVLNNAGAENFVVNENGTVTGLTVPAQILMANFYPGLDTCAFSVFWAVIGSSTSGSDESRSNTVLTSARTAKRLRYKSPANIESGATYTVTLRKNGASTALTCSVIQGAGVGSGELSDQECADTTHTVSLAAGDFIAYQYSCSGGSSGNPADAVSVELE